MPRICSPNRKYHSFSPLGVINNHQIGHPPTLINYNLVGVIHIMSSHLNERYTGQPPPHRYCSWIKCLVFLPILVGIAGYILNQTVLFRRAGPPSSSPACASPPLDNCSFYANCLESRYNCGPSGYPIGYGHKYCEKFSLDRSLFNSLGQQWMINTMHCLQMALVPDAIDVNATTCQALANQAFATHAGCYIDNGLCSLGLQNWVAILEIVDIKTLFQSWHSFKATVEAGTGCVEFFAFMIAKDLF